MFARDHRRRTDTAGDDQLIRAFLSGDRASVFRLTRWIGLEIRARGAGLAGRQREDLIQETLLRLWTVLGRGEFRGRSGLQRYVRAIAHHVVVDHLRKKPQLEVTGDASFPTEAAGTPNPWASLAARDLVERVLAGLPEEDGRLLVEAYVEEKPYADMAAARGIRRGTLKVRVFRAARRAREAWERLRGPDAAAGQASGAGRP